MRILRGAKRANFTILPNAILEDSRLSFRARGILAWVLAKPDDWSTNSESIAAAGTEGRDAVRSAMTELCDLGYLRREKRRKEGGTFETVLVFHEEPISEPAPGNPASVAQASVSQASNQDSEPRTQNQESSLRSEGSDTQVSNPAQEVAKAYWNWFTEENGGHPPQDFKAILSVAKACLKRDYPADEIVDAMKALRHVNFTAARVIGHIGDARRSRENRPSTAPISTAVMSAVKAARPWFERRWPGWYNAHFTQAMDVVARMTRAGYGVGESMLRLAVGMHDPDHALDVIALMRLDKIDRFPGCLADVPGCMETAYQNRYWKAGFGS